eukprot:scaffold249730_cov15-Tisochrysis_lutea.AAC.1
MPGNTPTLPRPNKQYGPYMPASIGSIKAIGPAAGLPDRKADHGILTRPPPIAPISAVTGVKINEIMTFGSGAVLGGPQVVWRGELHKKCIDY